MYEFSVYPGSIQMLPVIENWDNNTLWLPAEFINFDISRRGQEYKCAWISGAIWPEGEPPDATFYRSADAWDTVEDVQRLEDSQVNSGAFFFGSHTKSLSQQIGSIHLPLCFALTPENSPSLDPKLSHIFRLAVPTISRILADVENLNPVIQSYEAHFQNNTYTPQRSIEWMRSCSFNPTPALEAMLMEPLADLLQRAPDTMQVRQRIWGPGSVLLQLLAIQHSLDEPLDLNGSTFLDIQEGHIVPAELRAVQGLEAMWASVDPLVFGHERGWPFSELANFEQRFKAAHTIYDSSCDVVFYDRVDASLSPQAPHIRINHNGADILFAMDLPDNRPEKRRFESVESPTNTDVRSRKRGKKWEPKPTPPDVRRSSRVRDRKQRS